jgi:4-amino-4-deoxy-L-arabinose transferase-like glycosyltransferase
MPIKSSKPPANPACESNQNSAASPAGGFPMEWWVVIALTAVAAAIRFYKLGHASLWGDEINFILHSAYPTFGEYLDKYRINFMDPTFPPHLPFATVMEFVFTRFGTDEFWGRFSAAVFGTATVPMMFLAGRAFWDRATGLIAAALTAFSFFLIYYSRDANYYSPLVFVCVAFLAVFWTQLSHALSGRTPKLWAVVLVWFCGSIALQTHLAAVFFMVAIGLAAFWLMCLHLFKASAAKRGALFRKNFLPLVIAYLLCWPLTYPWALHTLKARGASVDIPPHRTLDKMLNLPWQFGWGNLTSIMAPAAVIFLACLLLGVVWGIKRASSRRPTWTLLWILGFVLGTYVVFSGKNGYMPHYVILSLPCVLLFAALGMAQIARWLAQKWNVRALAWGFPVAVLIVLAGFLAKPLTLLYALPGKPTDWRGVAEWIRQNLPPGSLVFFDWYVNVWQHVPTYYKTPGIQCASTLPVGSATDMIRAQYRQYTRSVLEKYPDTAYLEAMRLFDVDERFETLGAAEGLHWLGGRKWRWPDLYFTDPRSPHAFFRRRKSFRNEPILELDRLGLCPIGINYTTMGEVEPILYYNTTNDLIAIARERGQKVMRRLGAGFGWIQTQGFQPWRRVDASATVEIFKLVEPASTVEIQLTCVAAPLGGPTTAALEVAVLFEGNNIATVKLPMGKIGRETFTIEMPADMSRTALIVEVAPSQRGKAVLLVDDITVNLK